MRRPSFMSSGSRSCRTFTQKLRDVIFFTLTQTIPQNWWRWHHERTSGSPLTSLERRKHTFKIQWPILFHKNDQNKKQIFVLSGLRDLWLLTPQRCYQPNKKMLLKNNRKQEAWNNLKDNVMTSIKLICFNLKHIFGNNLDGSDAAPVISTHLILLSRYFPVMI